MAELASANRVRAVWLPAAWYALPVRYGGVVFRVRVGGSVYVSLVRDVVWVVVLVLVLVSVAVLVIAGAAGAAGAVVVVAIVVTVSVTCLSQSLIEHDPPFSTAASLPLEVLRHCPQHTGPFALQPFVFHLCSCHLGVKFHVGEG